MLCDNELINTVECNRNNVGLEDTPNKLSPTADSLTCFDVSTTTVIERTLRERELLIVQSTTNKLEQEHSIDDAQSYSVRNNAPTPTSKMNLNQMSVEDL